MEVTGQLSKIKAKVLHSVAERIKDSQRQEAMGEGGKVKLPFQNAALGQLSKGFY